jgi:hypothetical protein
MKTEIENVAFAARQCWQCYVESARSTIDLVDALCEDAAILLRSFITGRKKS